MNPPKIICVGATEFPLLYRGDPFESTITTGGMTETKFVQSAVRVNECGHLSYGIDFLKGQGLEVDHYFCVPKVTDLVTAYRCLVLLDGHPAITEKTLEAAADTVAEGQAEVGKWQEGRVKLMLNAVPPDLTQALLVLYDMQITFDRGPIEALLGKGLITINDELRLMGIKDPAEVRAREIRERDTLKPYESIVSTFRREHAGVGHGGKCKCDFYVVKHLLGGVRRGIEDRVILAGCAHFQYEMEALHLGMILVPGILARSLGERFGFRNRALEESVAFARKIAGDKADDGPRYSAESLCAAILSWDRKWGTVPHVKNI